MSNVIPNYITLKMACKIIGLSKSTMIKEFKKIRENNPNSPKFRGVVNIIDFERHFNIGKQHKKGERK